MQRRLAHPPPLGLEPPKGPPPDHYSYAKTTIQEKIDILCGVWPNLNPDNAIRYARTYGEWYHPGWVEGSFVLIRPGFFSQKPGEEIEQVLGALGSRWKVTNYRKGELGSKYLRRHVCSLQSEALMAEMQPGDLWILDGQFGKRYPGESVDDVRAQANGLDHGWCLGARDIGCMILTCPDRLVPGTRLHCPGDEYAVHGDGIFSRAPCFGMRDDGLTFDTHSIIKMYPNYGSPTGSIPRK